MKIKRNRIAEETQRTTVGASNFPRWDSALAGINPRASAALIGASRNPLELTAVSIEPAPFQ